MVHVLAPKPALAGLPVFYNVDVAVGQDAPNSNMEDVLMVQYFLSLIGKNPAPGSKLTELANVPVTGRINPETIAGITAIQTASGLKPDGRVSVAKGYRFGSSFYTIVTLNFNIRSRFLANWPNLDELPNCPGFLNLAARRALVGSD